MSVYSWMNMWIRRSMQVCELYRNLEDKVLFSRVYHFSFRVLQNPKLHCRKDKGVKGTKKKNGMKKIREKKDVPVRNCAVETSKSCVTILYSLFTRTSLHVSFISLYLECAVSSHFSAPSTIEACQYWVTTTRLARVFLFLSSILPAANNRKLLDHKELNFLF